jgi:hypothetical protein
MHPARFLRPKSTFLTIHILVAGTNSVSSGNILIVEESFFNKYVAEKLKVQDAFCSLLLNAFEWRLRFKI